MNNHLPHLSSLTFIGFEINSLPERSNCDRITFEYVYEGIGKKELLHKIAADFGDNIDFSLFQDNLIELEAINESLYLAAESLRGRERKKIGVEKSGQRLIVAILLEAIQQKYWEQKKG